MLQVPLQHPLRNRLRCLVLAHLFRSLDDVPVDQDGPVPFDSLVEVRHVGVLVDGPIADPYRNRVGFKVHDGGLLEVGLVEGVPGDPEGHLRVPADLPDLPCAVVQLFKDPAVVLFVVPVHGVFLSGPWPLLSFVVTVYSL